MRPSARSRASVPNSDRLAAVPLRWVALFAVLAPFFAAGSSALSAEPTADERGKALFDEGRAAMEAKDYLPLATT